MGSSIHVRYTDGPAKSAVQDIVNSYQSKGFDGTIDMQYSYSFHRFPDGSIVKTGCQGTTDSHGVVESWRLDIPKGAERVSVSSGFTFVNRELSELGLVYLTGLFHSRYGSNEDPGDYGNWHWWREYAEETDLTV